MPPDILQTRLFVPALRPDALLRRDLLHRLDAGLTAGYAVQLVVAPAGFGKTSLLAQWIRERTAAEGDRLRSAWLSLEKADSDPQRFWTCLVMALERQMPGVGRGTLLALQVSPPPAWPTGRPPSAEEEQALEDWRQAVLAPLVNSLAGRTEDGRTLLVLDDYHWITHPVVHASLGYWLERLPANLRLVISTRVDPPLPLSRLRARGWLRELRAADLRFSRAEVDEFLRRVMGLELSAEQTDALERRTEGWPAGLQMAGLALQALRDQSGPAALPGFIRGFSGSNQYILDYLAEEVLDHQPPAVQDFLLRTAILERFNAPLADALREADGSSPVESSAEGMLTALQRANLFLIPLDDQRNWFRYHHLFADLLRARLIQTRSKDGLAALHRRAAAWLEANGLDAEAVSHARAGGDAACIERILLRNWQTLCHTGQANQAQEWLDLLPEQRFAEVSDLNSAQAWVDFLKGDYTRVESLLQRARGLLDRDVQEGQISVESEGYAVIVTQMAALRSVVAGRKGDLPAAVAFAEETLLCAPPGSALMTGIAHYSLGHVYRAKGEPARCAAAFAQAMPLLKSAGNLIAYCNAFYLRVACLRELGRLGEAELACRAELAAAAGEDLAGIPVFWAVHAAAAETWLEEGRLEEAEQAAAESLRLGRALGSLDALKTGTVVQARVRWLNGDVLGAFDRLAQAETTIQAKQAWWASREVGAWKARLCLTRPEDAAWRAAARGWKDSVPGLPEPLSRAERISLVHALAQFDGVEPALAQVAALLAAAEAQGGQGLRIELLSLRADLRQQSGDEAAAQADRGEALALAQDCGFGLLGDGLLRAAQTRASAPQSGEGLVESLSERELEILALMAEGLSNRAIADRLVLALGTVKTHVHNIAGKLGTENRVQAIARARALGLLKAD